jgi:hypothetical protein
MALVGTHIRFALDQKHKYGVKNLHSFVTGTVYPDTRYTTHIDRELTHPKDFRLENLTGSDDFNKGWYLHLVADKVQAQIYKDRLLDYVGDSWIQNTEGWVNVTSAKIIQNGLDIKKFALVESLVYLDAIENPNGESLTGLNTFYKNIRDAYPDPNFSLETDIKLLIAMGLSQELVMYISEKCLEFQKDSKFMDLIAKVYDEMLKRAENF